MIARPTIGEEELSAFIDGELEPLRANEIGAALETNPALAQHTADLRADIARLKETYGPVADLPLPEAWRARIEGGSRVRDLLLSYRAIAAVAASFVIAFGATILWRQSGSPQAKDIVALALDARSNGARAEAVIVPASQDAASVTISAALRMRLKAPDLSRQGYTLASVQIYSGQAGDQPVELVYRNAARQPVTLYLRRSLLQHPMRVPDGTPLKVAMLEKGNVRICVWQGDALGVVLAGKMSWPEMYRLASLSYTLPL